MTAGGERREHSAESVLSLNPGAGPEQLRENGMASTCPLARPARFTNPARNAAYWSRIACIVDQAPPLTDSQRAVIRSTFHTQAIKEVAA